MCKKEEKIEYATQLVFSLIAILLVNPTVDCSSSTFAYVEMSR